MCYIEEDQVAFRSYPPQRRLGDNRYVDPPGALRDGNYCLARWHCHTEAAGSTELAGPGTDDLRYVDYFNCPLVILTHLNDKLCNVDYVSAEGVVIDLGNYQTTR